MKTCKKCGGTEFYKDGKCKPCRKAIVAASKKAHPETRKKRRVANYKANPDKYKDISVAHYRNNIEKERARSAAYTKAHPDKAFAKVIRRRVTKLNAIPKWFGELDELIISESYSLCKAREKETGIKWHVDHEVPLQSKIVCGLHIGCNIRVIPASINMSKGNRHWPDMP